jgi:hypothetical protein
MYSVSDVRQIEIYTAESLVPESSPFEFKITAKLKRYKSPGTDQIPAGLIHAKCRTLCSEINKIINPIWNTKASPSEMEESITVPIYQRGKTNQ